MSSPFQTLFAALFLMCSAPRAFGQEFTPTKQAITADSTGRAGNIDHAIAEWKSDYPISLRPDVAFTLAALYAIKEESDSAFWWLNIALEKDSSVHALVEGDYIYLSSQPAWIEIETRQIAKSEAQQGKYKNLDLSRKLWRLQMRDQAYTPGQQKIGQNASCDESYVGFDP